MSFMNLANSCVYDGGANEAREVIIPIEDVNGLNNFIPIHLHVG